MIGYRSSPSHRCDEFPAEYSSASCSPAELASASSAALMLQLTTLVRRANLSERQPGNSFTVSAEGFTPVPWSTRKFADLGQNSRIFALIFLIRWLIPCSGPERKHNAWGWL